MALSPLFLNPAPQRGGYLRRVQNAARLIQQPFFKKQRNRINHSGAAKPFRTGICNRSSDKSPLFLPDREDRTGERCHAAGEVPTLKGRPGSGRGRIEFSSRQQCYFSVRAKVEEKGGIGDRGPGIRETEPVEKCYCVPADKPARRRKNVRRKTDRPAELQCVEPVRSRHFGSVWRMGNRLDRQPKQQVAHGRIAGNRNDFNGACVQPCSSKQLSGHPGEFFIDKGLKLFQVFWGPDGVLKPGYDIQAMGSLRIEAAAPCRDLPARQSYQGSRDSSRAEVYRNGNSFRRRQQHSPLWAEPNLWQRQTGPLPKRA